ncbi:cytochrome P450 monooxygenase-like protein [Xylogone sp. PMI_703]|nr:cytochrome P450 monooxygenase-like protein [Xylogone sp. PMI_703]
MVQYIYIIAGLLAFSIIRLLIAWRRNVEKVKASGLPYLILPFTGTGVFFHTTHDLWLNFFQRNRWTKNWFWPKAIDPERGWYFSQEIRDRMSEIFMIASPFGTYLNIAHPDALAQAALKRGEFEKPIEVYSMIDIFGPSVVTTEGDEWKRHRKIVGPGFSEKSNALVWKESLKQAVGLLDLWANEQGNSTDRMNVKDTAEATKLLALHVISGVGFGVKQIWDGEDEKQLGKDKVQGFNTSDLKSNHRMTFKNALHTLLQNILLTVIFPNWVLEKSPFKSHKAISQAYSECGDYFKELSEYKIKQLALGEEAEKGSMDLMKPLVEASEVPKGKPNEPWMTKQEVISNSWILLFAGHETSANMIHFSLLFLAIALSSQRRAQAEIDAAVGDRDPEQWSYEVDMGHLYRGMVGAILNETLRLMPPVIDIPKIVRDKPQPLAFGGKVHMIPEKTFIHFNVVASHRNPKYWPHSPSKVSNKSHDLDDYVPERWILKGKAEKFKAKNGISKEGKLQTDGLETVSFETGEGLFTPQKGVFIPFSEGARSCPGKRFAQVEITAVLSVILRTYTVELDVREWASDEEVARMSIKEKRKVYEVATKRARQLIEGSIPILTLKMVGTNVPVRFVRRGMERFADI